MNGIKIADSLVQMRRNKGNTQKELAEYLQVSKAAVSKWEKGQSYPDISLLPQLATYFSVSIDDLLCYSPQLSREDTLKLCKRLSADFATKPFDEVMVECRSLIKKYYSCFTFLVHMAALLMNHRIFVSDQKQQSKVLEEAKAVCKRVVSESNDPLLAMDALHVQCVCSLALHVPDDVFAMFGTSLRTPKESEDFLISMAFKLDGNMVKAKEVTQCGMYKHLMALIESTRNYILFSEDDFNTAQNAYHRIECICLYSAEKLNAHLVASTYLIGANLYCKHGHLEKALDLLEKYADFCDDKFFPFKLQGDFFFTDIDQWLDSDELDPTVVYDKKVIAQIFLQNLNEFPAFTALQEETRYKSCHKKIRDFAKTE